MRTYCAAVLKLDLDDIWGVGDLVDADFDQVWDSLGVSDPVVYRQWFDKQPRMVRATLRSAGQSPKRRANA